MCRSSSIVWKNKKTKGQYAWIIILMLEAKWMKDRCLQKRLRYSFAREINTNRKNSSKFPYLSILTKSIKSNRR
jgi:hypothetical protein